jgi:hypothetical protein
MNNDGLIAVLVFINIVLWAFPFMFAMYGLVELLKSFIQKIKSFK